MGLGLAEGCAREGGNIWRTQFPMHLFFFAIAVIGFIKVGTLWGFAILGMSLLGTMVFSYIKNKCESEKSSKDSSNSFPEAGAVHRQRTRDPMIANPRRR